MQKSETLAELGKALTLAQSQIKIALKDSTNPFFKSRYADLGSCWDACREALTKNGLSVVQIPTDCGEGRVGLETMLLHSSGEWISGVVSSPLTKDDPQGVGSALTYLRRYGLSAMLGIVADDDDDGNAASQGSQAARARKPVSTTTKRAPVVNTAERGALYEAIKQAGRTLNDLGDEIVWNGPRAIQFANENFNTDGGVEGLTVPQLTEMAKLMSERIANFKPKAPVLSEVMKSVLANFKDEEDFAEYLSSHGYPEASKLTPEQLQEIETDVYIPF